jgi:hypothetical protein
LVGRPEPLGGVLGAGIRRRIGVKVDVIRRRSGRDRHFAASRGSTFTSGTDPVIFEEIEGSSRVRAIVH